MMNLDSTVWCVVGIWEQAGEHEGRWTMLKICVALIKEKGIRSSNIIHGLNQQVTGTTFKIHQTIFLIDRTTFQVYQTTFSDDRTTFQTNQTTKSVNGTTSTVCIVPDYIRLVKMV